MRKLEQLVLPLDVAVLIPEDDSVRLLARVAQDLNYQMFYQLQSRRGRPTYDPRVLILVLLYAYMNNTYSSRAIEKACKRDINYIWLLEGCKAPDHNTISRFRSGAMQDAIEDLFYQLVSKLGEMNEIAYENLFIDGTKIEANANRYTFVWKKSTEKNLQRLQNKMTLEVPKLIEKYALSFNVSEERIEVESLNKLLDHLEVLKIRENITFVSGKGTRKTALQRDHETLSTFITAQVKYDSYNEIFKGRNSFSKTDVDATFMRMKDDHMRNGQLKPAYNVQIGVEGEYIVGVDLFSERSDQLTFIPFMKMLEDKLDKKHENIVADAGYESEENYKYLKQTNQTSYIKPANYETSKKKGSKKNIGKRENMTYDSEQDVYICHNQKHLKYLYSTKRTSKSGFVSTVKIYECESCEGCPHKERCSKAKGNKRIQFSEDFSDLRADSMANITTEYGTKLRMNRSIQVEGAFGVLKEDFGFRKFLTRGKKNVMIEFILLSFGFNINKLHKKLVRETQGVSLFNLKVA
jgi:transposase